MNFKPIQQQKIYEQIVEQIKVMISQGNLKPGDKLPAERVLAENLNVSRASVREALSALHLIGLLDIKSGGGTYIKHNDINSIIQPLSLIIQIEKDAVVQVLGVRKGLEVEAAGQAAKNATEDDLHVIELIINEMEIESKTTTLGEVTDCRFHFAVVQASKNFLLIRLMNTISDIMQKTIKSNREELFRTKGTQQALFRQHRDIAIAVKKHDVEAARQKMYEHLMYAEAAMLK